MIYFINFLEEIWNMDLIVSKKHSFQIISYVCYMSRLIMIFLKYKNQALSLKKLKEYIILNKKNKIVTSIEW